MPRTDACAARATSNHPPRPHSGGSAAAAAPAQFVGPLAHNLAVLRERQQTQPQLGQAQTLRSSWGEVLQPDWQSEWGEADDADGAAEARRALALQQDHYGGGGRGTAAKPWQPNSRGMMLAAAKAQVHGTSHLTYTVCVGEAEADEGQPMVPTGIAAGGPPGPVPGLERAARPVAAARSKLTSSAPQPITAVMQDEEDDDDMDAGLGLLPMHASLSAALVVPAAGSGGRPQAGVAHPVRAHKTGLDPAARDAVLSGMPLSRLTGEVGMLPYGWEEELRQGVESSSSSGGDGEQLGIEASSSPADQVRSILVSLLARLYLHA